MFFNGPKTLQQSPNQEVTQKSAGYKLKYWQVLPITYKIPNA